MTETVLRHVFPDDMREGFRHFVGGDHQDGAGLGFIVDPYRRTFGLTTHSNILPLHNADMWRAPRLAFGRFADHIGKSHPPEIMDALFAASGFAQMKASASRFAIAARRGFWTNDADFFDSGTSNKWRGRPTPDDLAAYDARMDSLLSASERRWLEWGGAL